MNKETNEILIWGRRPILDVLQYNKERVLSVYLKEGVSSSFRKDIDKVCQKAKIKISVLPLPAFQKLFKDEVNHQGIAAHIKSGTLSFSEWLKTKGASHGRSVIVFDHLEDVGNVGAIIRTALAVGVEAVLVPKDRQAPVDGTMYKASAGAVDRMPIISIGNVSDAIRKLKDHGFWVMGLDADARGTIWDEAYDANVAFVVGSEGQGLHDLVKRECDTILRIPMESEVESLNASVSAAVLLYEWKRKQTYRHTTTK
ncbi:MAG: 23S rRNA (guanosine(2251)-2'-O)-methyltransferase RlmB [Candidatus Pacebacteria bacterium]|nr:23S rRNA (guanosine(2251)-2'-O)-methyltransferase RlmB [Candidatus Paceibacterota bacterium]